MTNHKRSLILFFVLTITPVFSQNSLNPNEPFIGLQGKIKTIISTWYKAIERNGKVVAGELTSSTHYDFNREGYLIMDRQSLPGREDYSKTIYEYNENNIRIRITRYTDSLVTKQSQVIYQEDNKQEWEIKDEDGSIKYSIREWNPETRIVWLTWLDEDRNITITGREEYDEQGNITKSVRDYDDVVYSEITESINSKIFQYGDRNEFLQRFTSVVYKDGWGASRNEISMKFSYSKYDKKGNWTERIMYAFYPEDVYNWIARPDAINRHTYIYYD